jgi:fibronectin type 3 domain-containing protein
VTINRSATFESTDRARRALQASLYHARKRNRERAGAEPALDTPTNVAATTNLSDKVTVTWDAVSGATGGYVVYRSTSVLVKGPQIATSVTNSYDDETAVAGTPYFYRIRALNGVMSALSNPAEGLRAL